MADFVNMKQAVDGTALCSFPEQSCFLVHLYQGRLCLLYSRASAFSKWPTGSVVLLLPVIYRNPSFYSVEKKTRYYGANSLEGTEHYASRCCMRHRAAKCCMTQCFTLLPRCNCDFRPSSPISESTARSKIRERKKEGNSNTSYFIASLSSFRRPSLPEYLFARAQTKGVRWKWRRIADHLLHVHVIDWTETSPQHTARNNVITENYIIMWLRKLDRTEKGGFHVNTRTCADSGEITSYITMPDINFSFEDLLIRWIYNEIPRNKNEWPPPTTISLSIINCGQKN
jgi:hypothetical protein